MTDYESLTYYQLKAECKKEGFGSKGTKVELLARLGVTDTSRPETERSPGLKPADNPPMTLQAAKLAETPPTQLLMPNDTLKLPVDNSKYAVHLTTERLSKLENMLAPICAGKGHFKFELDYEGGAFQVGFYGGAEGPVSTTLITADTAIVNQFKRYIAARLAAGKNAQISRL